MTQPHGINPYLRTKVMTAGPEELRLMLYDGAIRFLNQARSAMEDQQFEDGYHNLARAKKIVLELSNSLDPNLDADLCRRLTSLYTYIYRVLVEANINRETAKIDEGLDLLRYERQTWYLVMQHIGKAPASTESTPDPQPIPIHSAQPGPSQTTTPYAHTA